MNNRAISYCIYVYFGGNKRDGMDVLVISLELLSYEVKNKVFRNFEWKSNF